MSASQQWRDALAAWAIPEHILSQAPESPWIHPVALFDIPEAIEVTPSHARALEGLSSGGSVLDVGCGGGIATFALAPHIRRGVGVDHQGEMLEMYRRNASTRGIEVTTVEGFWPEVHQQVDPVDVAVAHHVVYNVGDIVPFLVAMNEKATSRVVIEMPTQHPLAGMAELWRHFWDIERPSGPTPESLIAVLADMGISANLETWSGAMRSETSLDDAAHFMRIRLCLPPTRESEVREFLASRPSPTTRPLATVWWDTSQN